MCAHALVLASFIYVYTCMYIAVVFIMQTRKNELLTGLLGLFMLQQFILTY